MGESESASIWPIGLGREKQLVNFQSKVRTNSTGMLKKMTIEGMGIAMLAEFFCRKEIDRGELVKIMPNFELEPLRVFGVYASRLQLTPKISAFMDFFENETNKSNNQLILAQQPCGGIKK